MTAITFQTRVQPWLLACFGAEIAADRSERNHRFLEESLELVQSCGCTASEAHQLVDYVFGRPVGEPAQEAGGVMVTLAALCLASSLDMHEAGETELARIWTKVEAIRAKQAAKPKHSPLPAAPTAPQDWRIDTSTGRGILVYKNCSVIEAEQAPYVLGLIAADAAAAHAPDQDADLGRTVDQRDTAEGWADGLAGLIGKYFGRDIGEHSSAHCPWQEAKDIIEEAEPYQPAAVAPQGEYPQLPEGVMFIEQVGGDVIGRPTDYGFKHGRGIVHGAQLFTSEQMRAYVDADRAARAEQPAAVAGPADELAELAMLNKLVELGTQAYGALAESNSDDGPAGTAAYVRWQERRAEMGELIRAHKAPALEAPAAPQQGFITGKPSEDVEVAWLLVRSLAGDGEGGSDEADTVVLALRGDDEQWFVAGDWRANSTLDSVHDDGGWIVGWMPYEVPAARLAAAPQAPAAPADGPPEAPDDAEAAEHWVSACDSAGIQFDGVAYGRGFRDGRTVGADAAAPAAPAVDALDAARLDWLEEQAKQSPTGISFDYVLHAEDGQVLEKGWRFMRRHFLGERKSNLRAAIDAAQAAAKGAA